MDAFHIFDSKILGNTDSGRFFNSWNQKYNNKRVVKVSNFIQSHKESELMHELAENIKLIFKVHLPLTGLKKGLILYLSNKIYGLIKNDVDDDAKAMGR
ncbi:hypothetical protein BpHYR1_027503 [Brachionus plicatilis]|uniref:Uncharacterized protein n=1 Tax=Brachionus plicatilis TaxID=10195 RepID=A0A3M7RYF6_BRAPC|nr:hypothetical protein BpHYR1_027503 [Brachionus plicatilis]